MIHEECFVGDVGGDAVMVIALFSCLGCCWSTTIVSLVLLAADLAYTPGCLVGGLLIDVALRLYWICFACSASRCYMPVLAADWVCIAWIAFRIGFGFACNAWAFLLQPGKGYSADRVVVMFCLGCSLKMLYESPGGNQVDGLPPA